MFLTNNLHHIFEVAQEERTDGDNFKGDMSMAHNLFLTGLTPAGKQYKCMEALDKPALLAEWEAVDDPQGEYDGYHAMVQAHYKALAEAFSSGDRAAFDGIVAGA